MKLWGMYNKDYIPNKKFITFLITRKKVGKRDTCFRRPLVRKTAFRVTFVLQSYISAHHLYQVSFLNDYENHQIHFTNLE